MALKLLCVPAQNLSRIQQSYHSQAVALQKRPLILSCSINITIFHNSQSSLSFTWHLKFGDKHNGSITHFFAAAGTCGTITGVGRYLKEKSQACQRYRRRCAQFIP